MQLGEIIANVIAALLLMCSLAVAFFVVGKPLWPEREAKMVVLLPPDAMTTGSIKVSPTFAGRRRCRTGAAEAGAGLASKALQMCGMLQLRRLKLLQKDLGFVFRPAILTISARRRVMRSAPSRTSLCHSRGIRGSTLRRIIAGVSRPGPSASPWLELPAQAPPRAGRRLQCLA